MEPRLICADSNILVDALAVFDAGLADVVRLWIEDEVSLCAPNLIHYEFTHALTKHVRNRRIAPTDAINVMDTILSLNVRLFDDDGLHRRALDLSMTNPGLSGYDGHFMALCERTGAELWTADKRLAAIADANGFPTRLWVT
jgi:predicted nucleic acid-binding protein